MVNRRIKAPVAPRDHTRSPAPRRTSTPCGEGATDGRALRCPPVRQAPMIGRHAIQAHLRASTETLRVVTAPPPRPERCWSKREPAVISRMMPALDGRPLTRALASTVCAAGRCWRAIAGGGGSPCGHPGDVPVPAGGRDGTGADGCWRARSMSRAATSPAPLQGSISDGL